MEACSSRSGTSRRCQSGDTQVLYQNGIRAHLVEPDQVLGYIEKLIVSDQGVHGNIDFCASQMGVIYGFCERGFIEVGGELSCSKSLAAEVNGISSCS